MFADIQSLFSTAPKRSGGLGAGLSAEDDPRFSTFQQAWKDGATHEDLFGPDTFRLHGAVGPSADNHRPDVAKVETFLGDAGYYKPMTQDGPTGWHNTNLDQAIRGFQKDQGLAVDGVLKPNGPTIGKIGSLFGGQAAKPEPVPAGDERPTGPWAQVDGGRTPGDPGKLKPPGSWDQGSDVAVPVPSTVAPRMPQAGPADGRVAQNNIITPHATPEQQAKYEEDYRKWVEANLESVKKNKELKALGYPPIPVPPPPRRPDEPIPGVMYLTSRPDSAQPPKAPDPFPGHTIGADGAEDHDRYAKALVQDSDPSKTADFLRNVISWSGDKGRGDVAGLLGRFARHDEGKAKNLQAQLRALTGETIPFRVAPLRENTGGPMADLAAGDSESVRLPKANPWGSSAGADPFDIRNMVDVLKTKGDYAGAVQHLQGEFRRDPEAARRYTAGLYDGLLAHNPAQAARFHEQMAEKSLVPEQKPDTQPQPKPIQLAQADTGTMTDAMPDSGLPEKEKQTGPVPAPAPAPAQQPPRTQTSQPSTTTTELPKPSPGHRTTKPAEEILKEAKANGGWIATGGDKNQRRHRMYRPCQSGGARTAWRQHRRMAAGR